MNNNFSFIIKDLRKKNNLTQSELASLLGVTFQAVSKWENDLSNPDTYEAEYEKLLRNIYEKPQDDFCPAVLQLCVYSMPCCLHQMSMTRFTGKNFTRRTCRLTG